MSTIVSIITGVATLAAVVFFVMGIISMIRKTGKNKKYFNFFRIAVVTMIAGTFVSQML
ncbi:hypothetical protein [Neobacillus drentensis]|uniref:hypothetical protein n=1 Tax=Neobacillus drentensis TaxID=220684 RepID=UPI003000A85F